MKLNVRNGQKIWQTQKNVRSPEEFVHNSPGPTPENKKKTEQCTIVPTNQCVAAHSLMIGGGGTMVTGVGKQRELRDDLGH